MAYKQVIIARKDLNMGPGKLAAQVSHASMAFITNRIKFTGLTAPPGYTCSYGEDMLPIYYYNGRKITPQEFRESLLYDTSVCFKPGVYDEWINDSFTKIVCAARNKNHLIKAIAIAEEEGLTEGKDFFLIKDNCLTDLTPEEEDPESPTGGRTLTCIGFRPLPEEISSKISKKFQLYR